MKKFIIFVLMIAFNSQAVVKRHDIKPELYELKNAPEYYVDMPFEGTAVLIDKNWLLAPAHVIYTFYYDYLGKPIEVGGIENKIDKIIFHPEYVQDQTDWGDSDPQPLMDFLNSHSDIALIKLTDSVDHINPIRRFSGETELGLEVTVYGKGAVGNGLTGELRETKNAGFLEKVYNWFRQKFTDLAPTQEFRQLNYYNNVITKVDERWIRFKFDADETALPLEGTIGSGDSGGPAVIFTEDKPILVGLASWVEIDSALNQFIPGKYDSVAVFVRVSSFNEWIDKVIIENGH
ncbi:MULTISPECIES: trypsin-like serine protease [unclassified Pseudoalteromonas]|uniref:trypsin-like serine protease n=1 Tax=unclassified Pseudoalteromonas TaxID=194690 RepID=UPI0015F985D3|nr:MULTISPECIES: trypsin-like serine protease [unclassified Pseudoalteromonas]MBB1349360.1 trypsin-like serine protease [Pseudoalteromonas sp. SG45-3]MBB1352519.1 trypsin-like serine protease [Pseudoalteromonas sp. SR45-5]MBB1356784.1 trypsin-like serine protease [Pseudoalteromonas sp. SG45-6]